MSSIINIDSIESAGYLILPNGNVLSKSGKLMSPSTSGRDSAYHKLKLRVDGKACQFLLHRLVASKYLLRGEGQTEVDHKDGNKTNNDVSNLEWVTPKENMHRARGLPYCFIKDGIVYQGKNVSDFCKEQGLATSNMSSLMSGKLKTAYGYCMHTQ